MPFIYTLLAAYSFQFSITVQHIIGSIGVLTPLAGPQLAPPYSGVLRRPLPKPHVIGICYSGLVRCIQLKLIGLVN